MPRPCKKRRICEMPKIKEFIPSDEKHDAKESILLALDEYEVIRLIDLEGLTQEECASQMGISRASVSAISENARRKMADMLVNGKKLSIAGGQITICEQAEGCCGTCGKFHCESCSNNKNEFCKFKNVPKKK